MIKKKQGNNHKIETRVVKIKGQLNGLEQMLNDGQDCLEILNQLAAIKGALSSLGIVITKEETNCLRIHKGDEKKLQNILDRFLKIN